jgi:predicted AAA+ superfamily ATPase
LARSFGISDMTARKYIDILEGTFMVRTVSPWYVNLGKRLVKRPKLYLRDSGLFHSLMNIEDLSQLNAHPKLGASWEGFALEQFLRIHRSDEAYFWSTYSGAELDLLLFAGGKRYGLEFKFNEAPKITKSMHVALHDLDLQHLWVVYPGRESYPVHEKITVQAITDISVVSAQMKNRTNFQ